MLDKLLNWIKLIIRSGLINIKYLRPDDWLFSLFWLKNINAVKWKPSTRQKENVFSKNIKPIIIWIFFYCDLPKDLALDTSMPAISKRKSNKNAKGQPISCNLKKINLSYFFYVCVIQNLDFPVCNFLMFSLIFCCFNLKHFYRNVWRWLVQFILLLVHIHHLFDGHLSILFPIWPNLT